MDYSKKGTPSPQECTVIDGQYSAQQFAQNSGAMPCAQTRGIARIARALGKMDYSGGKGYPVDTSNRALISIGEHPYVSNPSNKKLNELVTGKKKISYKLRSLYQAVAEINGKKQNRILAFITVNLSFEASRQYAKWKRGAASAYLQHLEVNFKKLKDLPDYFFVLEDSSDGSIHAHIVMSYNESEERQLREILLEDTKKNRSDVIVQKSYRRYHSAKHGTPEWELLLLDINNCTSPYTQYCLNKGRYYYEAPVDVGIADYISKHLHRNSKLLARAKRVAAPRRAQQAANKLYTEMHAAQAAAAKSN